LPWRELFEFGDFIDSLKESNAISEDMAERLDKQLASRFFDPTYIEDFEDDY